MLLFDRETEWSLLMSAALDGDGEAYARFLRSLAHPLRILVGRGLARARLPPGDVEDVVQETLLAIHLKASTWDRSAPIGPWIAAIARHKAVDMLRKRHRRLEVSIDDLVGDWEVAEDNAPQVTRSELQSLLAGLPDRQQQVIRSISLDGGTIASTARALGISEGAVRVGLHRGLKALAQQARKAVS